MALNRGLDRSQGALLPVARFSIDRVHFRMSTRCWVTAQTARGRSFKVLDRSCQQERAVRLATSLGVRVHPGALRVRWASQLEPAGDRLRDLERQLRRDERR